MTGSVPLIELRGITKAFGDLVANDAVDLRVDRGEVLALLGENGAGKSTLTRMIYGLSRPDSGVIKADGVAVSFSSPADAMAAGIGMVTQEFSLVGPMTVTENVMLSTCGLGPIDRAAASKKVAELASRLEMTIDPSAVVETLSVGEQQQVEILKALFNDCKLLILDEPTAVLVPQDVAGLFNTIRTLVTQGMGVIFISHKLHEVVEIADNVTVLRRGKTVATVPCEGLDPRQIAELMIGSPHAQEGQRQRDDNTNPGEPVLTMENLTVLGSGKPRLNGFTLTVYAGEIVGVAGVSGNGQTELVDVLSAARQPDTGSIVVGETDVTKLGVLARLDAGLGRLSEDRKSSIVPEMSVEMTLALEELDNYKHWGLLDKKAIRANANQMIQQFDIRARPTDAISALSGGNMQKVLLARSLQTKPTALVVAQPTRGLDVGACDYVYQQLEAVRDSDGGVLVVSEDLDELLQICDRIVVLLSGAIVGEVNAATTSPAELGLLMTGATGAALDQGSEVGV